MTTRRRPYPLSLRTTPQERALYQRGAAVTDCTVSEFVRRAAVLAARECIAEAEAEQRPVHPLTAAELAAMRELASTRLRAYQLLAELAAIRRRLEADACEHDARSDQARAEACRHTARLLGPGAHVAIRGDGRAVLVLSDGSSTLSAPPSDDDDEDPPADRPPAPRPAARQTQSAGAS